MNNKIIIGIHGLRNKPARFILKHWWKKSIREGLKSIDKNRWFFSFEMAYWASVIHKKPQSLWIRDPEHPRYLRERYRRSDKGPRKNPGFMRKKFLDAVQKALNHILLNKDMSLNFSRITNQLIRAYFIDLYIYLSNDERINNRLVRDLIRDRLARIIRKHKEKRILLIAHSMGSYIAYDVLIHCVPDVKIDTLVTIGSPLGLPVFISNMAHTLSPASHAKPIVPHNILNHWFNLTDLNDKIALDYRLKDNFIPNRHGVGVQDLQVYNDFAVHGDRNPHKSYGYLRTTEMANIIHQFFQDKKQKKQ